MGAIIPFVAEESQPCLSCAGQTQYGVMLNAGPVDARFFLCPGCFGHLAGEMRALLEATQPEE